jgi:hypothetical protein
VAKDHLVFCLPRLEIIPLLLARFSNRKSKIVAHYGEWPLYLRLVSLYLRLDTGAVERIIARITGAEIRKITLIYESAEDLGYSAKDVEPVSRIAEKLVLPFKNDRWVRLLRKLIGDEPATAYALKYVSHYEIYWQWIYVVSFFYANPDNDVAVVWNPSWSREWLNVVNEVAQRELHFFEWPRWYVNLYGLVWRLTVPFRVIAIALAAIATHGITFRSINKEHSRLMVEFIEPRRLGGSPFDPDFWIDEAIFKKDDVLFFLTRIQRRILQSEGHPLPDVLDSARARGYELVPLERLPYSPAVLGATIKMALGAIQLVPSKQSGALAKMFLSACKYYLEYAVLFTHHSSQTFLHFTHPAGNTGWRVEGPIGTSFCRQNGITSVVCQSNVIHFRLHEYCFDCYDVYLTWGKAWRNVLDGTTKFIKSEHVVGCHYLDALLPEYLKHKRLRVEDAKKRTVLIFTGDLVGGQYPFSRTLSFLEACCGLALAYPDFEFLIKTKHAADGQRVLANARFKEIFLRVQRNCRFLEEPQHEYVKYLAAADVVIAMGFTTPGVEAILLGIPTIYYDGFRFAGLPFRSLPGLIVADAEEMRLRFEDWLQQPHVWDLSGLDPYRDGHARERVNTILAGISLE